MAHQLTKATSGPCTATNNPCSHWAFILEGRSHCSRSDPPPTRHLTLFTGHSMVAPGGTVRATWPSTGLPLEGTDPPLEDPTAQGQGHWQATHLHPCCSMSGSQGTQGAQCAPWGPSTARGPHPLGSTKWRRQLPQPRREPLLHARSLLLRDPFPLSTAKPSPRE